MGIEEAPGRIGEVVNHEIDGAVELTVETRKGYNQNGVLFGSSGEDSPPVKGDKIVMLKIDGTGKYAVIGVFNETRGAKPGEKIFFARDEGGEIKSALSMLGDGSVKWELEDLFSLSAKKTAAVESKKKITAQAPDIELKGEKVVITGGKLVTKGSASPAGKGPYCGLPFCAFTGAPQCGEEVSGT
jgi:hypothetical protein